MNKDRKNLEFAALLHDIGKFYYRTGIDHSANYKNYTYSDFGKNGAHAKWSSDFIEKNFNSIIADLVLYHHNPKNSKSIELAEIIQNADWHSSGERCKGVKSDPKETPLISIFSEVLIKDNNQCDEKFVPLDKIDLTYWQNLIPDSKSIILEKMGQESFENRYERLWADFIDEINDLTNIFDFNTALALLYKYTYAIPSASWGSIPDISLYDHSKTTAALAVCRYLYQEGGNKLNNSSPYSEDQKVYMVISGDISGIQNFIFKISSPKEAQRGMSKRLRGRSLYLTLLTDAISSRIVEDLELTKANILFCGGGRFILIAPNTDDAKKSLENIKKNINKYFMQTFNAELYLALDYLECSANDLAKFGDVTEKLSFKLTEDKKHKFIDHLVDLFDFKEPESNDTCSVCGNEYQKIDDDEFRCDSCKKHEDLGKEVSNAKYMIKCFLAEKSNYRGFSFNDDVLKIAYILADSKENVMEHIKKSKEFVEKFEIIKLNDTDFLDIERYISKDADFKLDDFDKLSFSFSFVGNVVPQYPNNPPLYFEHLAQISKGADKLGILKMDVDDLGLIFSKGFNHIKCIKSNNDNEGTVGTSISRISTLSSQLDLFFSGIINKLAEEFVVYSDIDVLNLSDDERKIKFKEITLELQNDKDLENTQSFTIYKLKHDQTLSPEEKNLLKESKKSIPTIHINYSGGDDLLVLGPYDDIIMFADKLRTAFKEWTCKNDSINLSGGINISAPKFPIGKAVDIAEAYLEASKSSGKDKITLFNESVNWEGGDKSKFKSFKELFKFAEDLEKYAENEEVSMGIIFSMLYLWKDYFEKDSGTCNSQKKWESNNLIKCSNHKFVPKFAYKLRLLDSNSESYKCLMKDGVKNMPWINVPVSWVSLRMR